MKVLVIFSNSVLLRDGSQNAYAFLSMRRNKLNSFLTLDKEYKEKKFKGPNLLSEIFEVAAIGEEEGKFLNNCSDFWEENKREDLKELLSRLRKKFEKIFIFTAYPKAIYTELLVQGLVDRIYGVDYEIDDFSISQLKQIEIIHDKAIKKELEKHNMLEKFTYEPNRYGLLLYLIDIMIEYNLKKKDITLVGKGVVALPAHRWSTRHVVELEELL